MTNNQLKDHVSTEMLKRLISRAESGDRYTLAALRELQERRKAERQVDELTMWIKRLVRSLKNANPDSKLPRDAMDYLTAKGLISVGDILR